MMNTYTYVLRYPDTYDSHYISNGITAENAKDGFHAAVHACNMDSFGDDREAWFQAYEDIKNPDLRQQWAEVGRPYVETNFTLPVQIAALEQLLGV